MAFPAMRSLALSAASCAAWLTLAEAKVQLIELNLGPESSWQYVSKFAFDIGRSELSVKLRQVSGEPLSKDTNLVLENFLDEDWPRALAEEDPCKRQAIARTTKKIKLESSGEWMRRPVSTSIKQSVRPHVWYFAVSDCSRQLKGKHTFELELVARQENGSHFGVEIQWAPALTAALLLCLLATGLHCIKQSSFLSRNEDSLHPVIWALLGVLLGQFVSEFFLLGHLALYSQNGQGAHTLEVSAEICSNGSQVVQTALILAIALGYTLTKQTLQQCPVVIPVSMVVALIQIGLVIVDKVRGADDANRFTDHEGIKGVIFLLVRLAFFAWFLQAAKCTADQGGLKLRAFVAKFTAAGSLFLLAYPVAWVITHLLVAPYRQKIVMQSVMVLVQVLSNVWLSSLFLDRRSTYYENSSLGHSLLPIGSSDFTAWCKND